MQCYAVLAPDLLRGEIIRRNVCSAVALHTWGYRPSSTALEAVLYRFLILYLTAIMDLGRLQSLRLKHVRQLYGFLPFAIPTSSDGETLQGLL